MPAPQCPFCHSEVSEALITDGGPCPKCFAEIPGEEAATDPGEVVKAKFAKSDNRKRTFRIMFPFLVASPFVGLLGAVALYLMLRPDPVVQVMDLGDLDMVAEIEIEHAPAEEQPLATSGGAKVASTKGTSKPSPAPSSGSHDGTATGIPGDAVADAGTPLGPKGAQSGGVAGPAEMGGGLGNTQKSGLDGFDVVSGVSRLGAPLSDSSQILQMVLAGFSSQKGTLTQCYNTELKVNESLQGKWLLKFTVREDGSTGDIAVSALGSGDPTFEQCLTSALGRFRFQRIAKDQPVQRTLAFKPAY